VNETFSMVAAVAEHGAQSWSGVSATAGTDALWSLAGVFHDPEEPWTFRFGFAQERQQRTPVTGADLIGLGWVELRGRAARRGALRRGLHRDGRPTSYDDRVIASVGVGVLSADDAHPPEREPFLHDARARADSRHGRTLPGLC